MLDVPTNYEILSLECQAAVKLYLQKVWFFRNSLTHNPSPNPVTLTRSLMILLRRGYVVCEKSDGVRYLLVLLMFAEKPLAVLVNRDLRMFQVEVKADKEYFQGSVFDGELVFARSGQEEGDRIFLVFDVVSHRGVSTKTNLFWHRYKLLNLSFQTLGEVTDQDMEEEIDLATTQGKVVHVNRTHPIKFAVKPFADIEDFAEVLNQPREHDSDGFIFTPISCPVLHNTHRSMFKWKYTASIDLSVKDGELWTFEEEPLRTCVHPRTLRVQDFPEGEVGIFEFQVTSVDSLQVQIQKFRTRKDKAIANTNKTILNILESCIDKIQIQDILQSIKSENK